MPLLFSNNQKEQTKSFLLVNNNCGLCGFIKQASFNACIFILYVNVRPFVFPVMLFIERQYSMFHGTSNRDDYRTVQWNSSRPSFHLKIDVFLFIYRPWGYI